MKDECFLREKAQEAIRNGKLPAVKPGRTWGGPGNGTRCSMCGEPVTQGQMELEIEYRRAGTTPGLDKYYLHVRCFAVWESVIAPLTNGTISSNGATSGSPRLSSAPSGAD
jgi:hypothetical protein